MPEQLQLSDEERALIGKVQRDSEGDPFPVDILSQEERTVALALEQKGFLSGADGTYISLTDAGRAVDTSGMPGAMEPDGKPYTHSDLQGFVANIRQIAQGNDPDSEGKPETALAKIDALAEKLGEGIEAPAGAGGTEEYEIATGDEPEKFASALIVLDDEGGPPMRIAAASPRFAAAVAGISQHMGHKPIDVVVVAVEATRGPAMRQQIENGILGLDTFQPRETGEPESPEDKA